MGDAQRGDDAIAFYAASIGKTRKLVAAPGPTQMLDADGPLAPGRYLLHIAAMSNLGVLWVAIGAFEKGSPLSVAADVPFFPMQASGIVAIETNVLKGDSDRIAVIAAGPNSPTGTLFITPISRSA